MKRYHPLLLAVWREACRHIEIGESTSTVAAVLAREIPLGQLVVRRLDLPHARLETVAVESMGGLRAAIPGQTPLTADQVRELVAWGGTRHVIRRTDRAHRSLFSLLAPHGLSTDTIAGPLSGPDGLCGVLLLASARGRKLDAHHLQLFDALLDPFSAALENDRRLLEMKTLREAAEADRRSLLTRLGRRELTTTIVGADAGLRHVMSRVDTVCGSDVPVLLLGETGTGKEVVARAIHDRSPRHNGPFIRVNCGAIPHELIDSQLFGHERGSFTGAVDAHQGWFERADGGTLFLDEIGELPAAAQVRLLRVLQDGFMERVGGRRSIHVNVRVVAATHRDLASMVRDRLFREDLWYRIAVFPIPIPPLRERSEDIPAIACHFAEKAATRFGLPLVMPTPDDLRLLATYVWPGNVRELAAVIDRAALLGNGRSLDVGQALGAVPSVHGVRTASPRTGPADATSADPGVPADGAPQSEEALDNVTRRHIESVLRETHGRVEGPFGAARRLKINPHTLRSRMRRLGIDWRAIRERNRPDEPG